MITDSITFENNKLLSCGHQKGSIFSLIEVAMFFMKNNTLNKIGQTIIYCKNAKITIIKMEIDHFNHSYNYFAGLFYIFNSSLNLHSLKMKNIFYDFQKPLISAISSKIIIEESVFNHLNTSKNQINFYFILVSLLMRNVDFRTYNKGLVLIENSIVNIFSTLFSNNYENTIKTSELDIFSALKIVNCSSIIQKSIFIDNADFYKDSGVRRFFIHNHSNCLGSNY